MASAGETSLGRHCPGYARTHHDFALWPIQFLARQLDGPPWFTFCGLRGDYWALRRGTGFQHLGGDWFYLTLRRLGDEWHSHHQRLLPRAGERYDADGGHVSCGRAADEADPHDDAVGLYRPVARRHIRRYRQPGAEAACDGDRGWHADRAGVVAACCAGLQSYFMRGGTQQAVEETRAESQV